MFNFVRAYLAVLLVTTVAVAADPPRRVASSEIVINQRVLTRDQVATLENRLGLKIQTGRYWYDTTSGAWGFERGPVVGVIAAGLDLGPLRADASGGGTGVFINGRELHPIDVWLLSQLGPVLPGQWWVDARGNFGPQGGPAWGNLYIAAQMKFGNKSPWKADTMKGQTFMGRDSDGCSFYQAKNLGSGSTTYFTDAPC